MPIRTIRRAIDKLAGKPRVFAPTAIEPSQDNHEDWQRKIDSVKHRCAAEITGYQGAKTSDEKTLIRHQIEMLLAEVFSKELRECCLAADAGIFKQGMKEAKKRTPALQETYLLSLIHDISDENAADRHPPHEMSDAKTALYDLVNGIWAETTHPRGSQPDEAIAHFKKEKSKLNKTAPNYEEKRNLLDRQINLEKKKREFPHICSIVNEFLGIQTMYAPAETATMNPLYGGHENDAVAENYVPSAFASDPPDSTGLSDAKSDGKLASTPSRAQEDPEPSRH